MGRKAPLLPAASAVAYRSAKRSISWQIKLTLALVAFLTLYHLDDIVSPHRIRQHPAHPDSGRRGWGHFPKVDDAFRFLPCTNATVPPALDDPRPVEAWARLYDADPSHWSWANSSSSRNASSSGGLYLCGWLDVPLDYTNTSDPRIARLAVTKLQHSPRGPSKRILVVEPGGPGGSGSSLVWRKAEKFSAMYTDSTFDVFGWDPRGVNASQPSISCFPYDADRDRYALYSQRSLREAADARQRPCS
ncbi:hypothetical protein EX895_003175 [Sporisorium graminicola]|uniref:Uncharacterized protein n=1 Tax=Sporisorium graminicola TaxID=280036 RepID=A0A4V6EU50_9BASI|nr:hypothetical protein EX895_003175 [Sporisorium graminicola]TKY88079.1 hypothetical protein EX895_003175 [Sporisorium graminicola]